MKIPAHNNRAKGCADMKISNSLRVPKETVYINTIFFLFHAKKTLLFFTLGLSTLHLMSCAATHTPANLKLELDAGNPDEDDLKLKGYLKHPASEKAAATKVIGLYLDGQHLKSVLTQQDGRFSVVLPKASLERHAVSRIKASYFDPRTHSTVTASIRDLPTVTSQGPFKPAWLWLGSAIAMLLGLAAYVYRRHSRTLPPPGLSPLPLSLKSLGLKPKQHHARVFFYHGPTTTTDINATRLNCRLDETDIVIDLDTQRPWVELPLDHMSAQFRIQEPGFLRTTHTLHANTENHISLWPTRHALAKLVSDIMQIDLSHTDVKVSSNSILRTRINKYIEGNPTLEKSITELHQILNHYAYGPHQDTDLTNAIDSLIDEAEEGLARTWKTN